VSKLTQVPIKTLLVVWGVLLAAALVGVGVGRVVQPTKTVVERRPAVSVRTATTSSRTASPGTAGGGAASAGTASAGTATTAGRGTGGPGPGGGSSPQSCGSLPFAASSDYEAADITIRGGNCATALTVARASEPHRFDPRAPGGPVPSFTSNGFQCTGQSPPSGLARSEYRCTSGAAAITFDRTGR